MKSLRWVGALLATLVLIVGCARAIGSTGSRPLAQVSDVGSEECAEYYQGFLDGQTRTWCVPPESGTESGVGWWCFGHDASETTFPPMSSENCTSDACATVDGRTFSLCTVGCSVYKKDGSIAPCSAASEIAEQFGATTSPPSWVQHTSPTSGDCAWVADPPTDGECDGAVEASSDAVAFPVSASGPYTVGDLSADLAGNLGTVVIRTDYSDDEAWAAAKKQILVVPADFRQDIPETGVIFVENRALFDGVTAQQIVQRTRTQELDLGEVYLADGTTMQSAEHSILVVEVGRSSADKSDPDYRSVGESFRAAARCTFDLWSNLSLLNVDFVEYAATAKQEKDGVLRDCL